jgi:hypothetical protein
MFIGVEDDYSYFSKEAARAWAGAYICMCVCFFLCVCTHTYICTYIYMFMCVCVCIHRPSALELPKGTGETVGSLATCL